MSITSELERIIDKRDIIREELQKVGLVDSDSVTIDEIAEDIPKNMVVHGAVSVEVLEGSTYTIPAGFHNGGGTVTAITDVEGDISKRYKRQSKTVTPTKSQQGVGPDDGYYALESVIVNPIPDKYKDVSSANVTAPDVLTGVKFVGANGLDAGTMANNGAVTQTLTGSTTSYTIPKGYHSGEGSVSITPQSKAVTSTKTKRMVYPDSGKVITGIEVLPIPDQYQDVTPVTATADMVLNYAVIVDKTGAVVEGTMPNNGTVTETIDTNTTSYTIPAGYHSGAGKVSVTTETKTATPTKATQNITPTSGKVLSKVTVNPIPAAYQDVTGVTATADKVLAGSKFVDADGDVVEGTMVNHGSATSTFSGLTTTAVYLNGGYYDFTVISLNDDIENALKAI